MADHSSKIDRLSIRKRPTGLPLMRQHWGKLLFIHWPIRADLLRPLVPSQLSIDTFDGTAWIGLVPFTMWRIRASFLPPIPGTNEFHELNVRTYVHYQGTPGVWFFSLDAANSLAVWGARTFYYLPYFHAKMELREKGSVINYNSQRADEMTYQNFFANDRGAFSDLEIGSNVPQAKLQAQWMIGEPQSQSTADSLTFFLTERYCLYSIHRSRVYRARIFHEPWPLRDARLEHLESTMIESLGLPSPEGTPMLNYAEMIDVDIWPLRKV